MNRSIFRLLTCLLIFILGLPAGLAVAQGASAQADPARAAFDQALADYNARHNSAYSINQYGQSGDLAYATAQAVGEDYFVLLAEQSSGSWVVLIPRESPAVDYNRLLNAFPEDVISAGSKAMLQQPEAAALMLNAANFTGHKLPWAFSKIGYVTQKDTPGSHENQIDFDIQGWAANGDVYASKPGTVIFIKQSSSTTCQDPPPNNCWRKANMVVVKHSDTEYSWYVHLAYNSVPVKLGQNIGYGTKIGVEGETGYSFGVHLHYMVSSSAPSTWPDPSDPNAAPWPSSTSLAPVDFAESTWANLVEYPTGPAYTSQNTANLPPVCPGAGGVLLYRDKDFSCANQTQNSGYVFLNTVGKTNMPAEFDHAASSIRVPDGWSALLYAGATDADGTACVEAPGSTDLASKTFDSGTAIGTPVNDQVSAVKVFYGPGCTGSAADPNPIPADTQLPAVTLTAPTSATLLTNTIPIQASATDAGSGVTHGQFFAGYYDGTSWAWHSLGYDTLGSDGWSWTWDASAVPDQTGVIFFANAWDRAGNSNGSWLTEKVLDRLPPSINMTSLAKAQNSNRFQVGWNASDPASGVDHVDLQYQDQTGASSSWPAWQTLLTSQSASGSAWFDGLFDHTYAFRAAATDRAAHTSATSAVVTTTISPCSDDAYEPDNDKDHTQALALDTPSPVHWICGPGDVDWYTFTPTAGTTYLFATSALGPATDTVLDLIAADGTTLIQEADDASSASSNILWTASGDACVYLRVRHASPLVAGTGVTYTVKATTSRTLYIPAIFK